MDNFLGMESLGRCKNPAERTMGRAKTFALKISDHVSLSAYEDCRPRIWKVAALQKGLILVHDGIEIIGEGTGFGFPVMMDVSNTYFSGSAKLDVRSSRYGTMLRKEFIMDRVCRDRFRNIRLENAKVRRIADHFSRLYQRHNKLPVLPVKNLLFHAGVRADFIEIPPAGVAEVIYSFSDHSINVKVRFVAAKSLKLERTFILNELSSRYLRQYSDSLGQVLADNEIGAWAHVDARWAMLTTLNHSVGFRVWNQNGCIMRRGREYIRDSMDWIGLDFEIESGKTEFEYNLDILENK